MSERSRSRRRFLKTSAGVVAASTLRPRSRVAATPRFDLVARGGTILDGTGAPAFAADIGVEGDAITAIGEIPTGQAEHVINARGLHVAPGFIDIHSHSDGSIIAYPTADSRALQGVTTELTGNCVWSAAPLPPSGVDERRAELRDSGVEPEWTDVASFLTRLERDGISVNQALLLGQGSLRENEIGLADRPLTHGELTNVLLAVEQGMDQGAFGLSTGLEYTPGRYTPTGEIVAMARVVARRGGLYASHVRNEEEHLLEAVDEAIAIGRAADVRVEVSHLKAAGRAQWRLQGGALDLIESARRQGVDVLADAYPYTAYSTGLTIFFSAAALEGGNRALVARLRSGERARLRDEVAARVRVEPGDYDLIVISSVRGEANGRFVGRNLYEIAEAWKVEPIDALLRLIEEEEGAVSFIGHGMSEANVEMVLDHPLVMVGSDGSAMAPVGKAAATRPHPRSYGAFARVLAHYVREREVLSLPEGVKKMTSMPADHIGLRDRGLIARGKRADLVVFDAASVRDVASFDDPHRYAAGISDVIVNGTPVVSNGQHTGARPGRALRS